MPQRNQGKRFLAIVLAFVAAVGLGVAAFGPRWLTEPNHEADGFGLMTARICEGSCMEVSVSELLDAVEKKIARVKAFNDTVPPNQQVEIPKKPWHGFAVVGVITFIACLLAAAGLVVGAIMSLAGKRPELPVMPTTVAVIGLFFAIVNGCIFVATKPQAIDDMEVGWTFLMFGGAVVLGLAAVFPLNRQIRPIDHELGEASATSSWSSELDNM